MVRPDSDKLHPSSTLNQLDQHRDEGDDQKNVNGAAHGVAGY